MKRKSSIIGFVLLLGLLAVFSGCSMWEVIPNPTPTPTPTPTNQDDGGINFTLPDLAGNEVTFRSFRGKPAVVFFFKSYCPHCQDEAPFLESVYRKYQDRVTFLGVAVNEQGISGSLIASTTAYAQQITSEFVNVYGWTFTVLIDDYGRVQRELVGTGVPSFVFIDENGMVQGTVKDTVSQGQLEQLIQSYLF
ncbi:MAG: TlpA family protein disulfide reductase [Candidatus Atribacteria bacterium]|nr:TlpA family protein disulfide reductase [Candidatus Atribacteria bacterium]